MPDRNITQVSVKTFTFAELVVALAEIELEQGEGFHRELEELSGLLADELIQRKEYPKK